MARLAFHTFAAGTLVLAALGPLGCAMEEKSDETDSVNVDTAELELTTVPASGVACIAVTVTVGSQTVKKYLSVTANGSTASLSLGQLPLGTATINANAYSLACSNTTVTGGTAQANWVADTVSTKLESGVVTSVELQFRQVTTTTVSANFVPNVTRIEADGNSTFMLLADKTLKVWGLIDAAANAVSAPQVVAGLTDVVDVASSPNFNCAVKGDGTVWCWGENTNGQLGNGTTTSSATPVQVTGLTGMTDVTLGVGYACASSATTVRVACWGLNGSYQLGNNAAANSSTPVLVSGAQGAASKVVAAQSSTCVLFNGTNIWCWGANSLGQSGSGSTSQYGMAIPCAAGNGLVDLVAGADHFCALRADGTVTCWGRNDVGQVGSGTTTDAYLPVAVAGVANVTSIAATRRATCASTKDGVVYCWGSNQDGGLGNGTGAGSLTPVQVPNLTGVTRLSAGLFHFCAETTSKVPYCWGGNVYGQLGVGDTISRHIPVAMTLE